MNKLLFLLFAVFISVPCYSSPYFRLVGPQNYNIDAGDVWGFSNGNQYGVSDLALVTHSTKDGSIIPQSWQKYIVPEDWVPLQVGGGGSFTGNAVINVGSSVNLAPQVFTPLFDAVGSSSPWVKNLKSILTEGYSKSNGLSIAAGPTWYLLPVENGTLEPVSKWQGHFGWFTGANWKF